MKILTHAAHAWRQLREHETCFLFNCKSTKSSDFTDGLPRDRYLLVRSDSADVCFSTSYVSVGVSAYSVSEQRRTVGTTISRFPAVVCSATHLHRCQFLLFYTSASVPPEMTFKVNPCHWRWHNNCPLPILLTRYFFLKTNEPILLQIGTRSPWDKEIKHSTSGVRRSKVKITRRRS